MPTTTTTYHLTAITDASITRTHLGAKERPAGKTWCGVQLLVQGDKRFGGRYKDIVWTEVVKTSPEGSTDDSDGEPDLTKVTCGACKRSAPWKSYLATLTAVYTTPAPKPPKTRQQPATTGVPPQRSATVSANEAQEMANRAADAGAPAAAAPSAKGGKRPGPRERSAAKDKARLAAEAASGSSVIEADPETGLPRIKPEIAAKADAIVAGQKARNAETEAAAARIEFGETTVEAEVIDILKGSKK